MDNAFGKARVVGGVFGRPCRLRATSLLFFDHLEEGDRHQTLGRRDQWIASLIPFGVVFARNDMKEVSLVKWQLFTIFVGGLVVVEGLDDFLGRDDGDVRFLV